MIARATSFATLRDLRNYINCLLNGGSETHCYNYGDNGTGAWGDNTAQLVTPMCALPPSEMKKKWGDSANARGKKVKVTVYGRTATVEVGDKGPDGVIDLNPAALQALGLPTDTELDADAIWEWL